MTRYVPPPKQYTQEPTTPFAEHAAKFSLYAPVAVFLVGCCMFGNKDRGVGLALAGLSVLLITAGLCLGIFAVVSVKKYGPERILGRAISGIILNGIALAMIGGLLVMARSPVVIKRQLPGRWQLTSSAAKSVKQFDVTFTPDGTFKASTTRNDGAARAFTGTWDVTSSRLLRLNIQNVVGSDVSMKGQDLGLGVVKSIDAKQMTLSTSDGDETYQRVR